MTIEEFPTLLLETQGPHVLVVTLNRPEVANAFNTQMARDLVKVFEDLALDSETIRCVVLTGAGNRAFCAGGDLKERDGMDDETWGRQHLVYERMIRAILDCPLPIIGAVNGAAYGGGCEIAAATDFVYAADGARFALTETSLGIIPGAGGTQTLTRAIGERRAKEYILCAKPFSAAEAMEWGLVNALFPQQRLLEVIGESGHRDVSRGMETGRFAIANQAAVGSLLSGAVIGTLSGRLEGVLDDGDLDDAVEYLLRLLGVPAAEALDIAHRPLPPLPAS